MRFLLDTHIFIWFVEGSPRLSQEARVLVEGVGNDGVVSVASLWEITIKASLGKLELDFAPTELAQRHVRGNGFELLGIAPEHLDVLASLPLHHRDPFDRLLIAQGIAEKMPILTDDRAFQRYAVQVV
jgi:PIN domain nuclease of toxin-antitoxin system